MSAQDHYTIISADTHAGANHETYREYLDPKYATTSTRGAASTRTRGRT